MAAVFDASGVPVPADPLPPVDVRTLLNVMLQLLQGMQQQHQQFVNAAGYFPAATTGVPTRAGH